MNREEFKFEICANSVESCLAAQEGGADRVELCAGIPEGGTTPSYGEIKLARKLLTKTKLHVIIRPRGGDFLYTPLELERMEEDIRICRELGVDGVVFGCLTEEGEIDREANRRLVELARPMSVTFHRAFDRTADPMKALEDIISLGCNRILTSGQQPKAIDGISLLAQLEKKLKEYPLPPIQLLAGSGINEENIRQIFDATGIHEYHFSARVNVVSKMKHYNHEVYMGAKGADESYSLVTSAEKVRNTIKQLI
ncbi:copper homeostasis protein CutC [Prevotella hominis]|uniref:copper homeostasis protein CutC n=1 Tax=Segatella hominis TaxID=2518605 RepID=UPI001F428F47|nr:copper homeostasis protein CutC [Segatella hominis]MCF2591560.1 copper homeostasis protein CutC [Segatella hominis]